MFIPGKSGNPGGRRRAGFSVTDHVKELLLRDRDELKVISDYLEGRGEHNLGRVTVARLLACRLILSALAGQAELFKELLVRTEGKVADIIRTEDKRKISIRIELAAPNARSEQVHLQPIPTAVSALSQGEPE
jgi:hypothetical protein